MIFNNRDLFSTNSTKTSTLQSFLAPPRELVGAKPVMPAVPEKKETIIDKFLSPFKKPSLRAELLPGVKEGVIQKARETAPFNAEAPRIKLGLAKTGELLTSPDPEERKIAQGLVGEQALALTGQGLKQVGNKIIKPSLVNKVFKNFPDLSTKILGKLEGRSTVSKQFISDLTNSGDLKQVERDIIRQALEKEGDKVDVAKFAEKVKAELLPLKRTGVGKQSEGFQTKYENTVLPKDMRGNVKEYYEPIYQSPIKTSANQHFKVPNYFGHTRVEDMADGKTRRVIEVQSDLYQKGNLERERTLGLSKTDIKLALSGDSKMVDSIVKRAANRAEEIRPLEQYSNGTAHERMIREEIKKAAEDGKTKLQFPTGETAMKIEGLGEQTGRWYTGSLTTSDGRVITNNIEPRIEDLKVGKELFNLDHSRWIITDVLGEPGKFKAIPKESLFTELSAKFKEIPEKDIQDFLKNCL